MHIRTLLYLLNEFLPVIGFFIAAEFTDFYTATSVLMGLTACALLLGWYFERHLPVLPIISGFFVIISGVLTLLYQSPDALIFADSLYYFLMGLTIATGLVLRINVLKYIFGRIFAMSDTGWRILSLRWVIIFILGGAANEAVRILGTPELWVHFKVLKVITIAIFGLYQFTLARRYRIEGESNEWGLRL